MALTNIEYDYLSKMPATLKGIEEQLKRIADSLEKISEATIKDKHNQKVNK